MLAGVACQQFRGRHEFAGGQFVILLRRGETLFLNTCPVPEVAVRRDFALTGDLHQFNPARAKSHKIIASQAQLLRRQDIEPVATKERKAAHQRVHRTAIERVAHQQAGQVVQAAKVLVQRAEIEQRLRRVLVGAITGIDYRYKLSDLGSGARGPRAWVAQHDRVRVGLEDANSIFKGLAFSYRSHRLGILNIQRLTAQAFDRTGKRTKGTAGRLKEQKRDDLTGQDL